MSARGYRPIILRTTISHPRACACVQAPGVRNVVGSHLRNDRRPTTFTRRLQHCARDDATKDNLNRNRLISFLNLSLIFECKFGAAVPGPVYEFEFLFQFVYVKHHLSISILRCLWTQPTFINRTNTRFLEHDLNNFF